MYRCRDNEAKWLANEIRRTKDQVDIYSEASVNEYNNKIARHTNMTEYFNRNCSGKQSESAYRAAQELNKKNIKKKKN